MSYKLKYVKVLDGKIIGSPINTDDMRKEFPNISFPDFIDQKEAKRFGYCHFFESSPDLTEKLSYDEIFEENTPKYKDGAYYQSWKKVKVPEHEKQKRILDKWDEVREKRNQLLKDSDWMVLPDSPLTEEQKKSVIEKRKRLRDITKVDNPFYISFADITFE